MQATGEVGVPVINDVLNSNLFKYTFDETSKEFLKCHLDSVNVLLHLLTTPIGVVGALSLLRYYTKSSSAGVFVFFCYLVSLLPALPTGVYAGTLLMSFVIVELTRRWKLKPAASLALIFVGYALQDLAHLGTGEETYQSKYSDGGHIDLQNPHAWSKLFFEHVYYLIPLVIHSTLALPIVGAVVPTWLSSTMSSPLPEPLHRLRSAAKILFPLVSLAYGSYCLDTKNSFCFFPGAPYYHRVLQCNIARDAGESHQKDLQKVCVGAAGVSSVVTALCLSCAPWVCNDAKSSFV